MTKGNEVYIQQRELQEDYHDVIDELNGLIVQQGNSRVGGGLGQRSGQTTPWTSNLAPNGSLANGRQFNQKLPQLHRHVKEVHTLFVLSRILGVQCNQPRAPHFVCQHWILPHDRLVFLVVVAVGMVVVEPSFLPCSESSLELLNPKAMGCLVFYRSTEHCGCFRKHNLVPLDKMLESTIAICSFHYFLGNL